MTIEELIADGRAKLEAAQLEETRRLEEEARKFEERRLERVALFLNDVRALIDPVLHPYLTLPESNDPALDKRAIFNIPNCTQIHVTFSIRRGMEHYQPYNSTLTYVVSRPTWDTWDGLQWTTAEFETLSYALVAARNYRRELDEMKAREEARKTEAGRQAREQEDREDRRAKSDADRRVAQDLERQDLLDLLSNDLVGFHLLRAFADIQAEREAWEEKLESASQSMEEIEDGHARRLEAVEKRAQAAQRDAEDAHARETEARDDAEIASRKLKQAQRGG